MSWLRAGCAWLSRPLVALSARGKVVDGRPELGARSGEARHQGVEVPDELAELGVVHADGVEQARQAGEEGVDHLLAVGQVVGHAAVSATMFETVPDSPWNTSMIEPASWLTWSGERAANRGWKPSNTAVRSIAGFV